ncbi:hypothetical protein CWC25_05780 [Pseudoalteromonas sp. S4389]|uniref:hypothetical protein n=1 Tax=Pseudoalteromonas sp. S4389 TaxID=579556 RepID=UPI001107DE56|nr:hypothetical protein [Pseudoalteromonas sp. S4389]TMO45622.1 hypothetical protein CWC25_05780 [Pseudoalteromonas sp. S4389]
MGFWIKVIGGAVVGVGAVAAAPFTGGGSLLGAATLATSLTGAGVLATGAGVAGAATGAYFGRRDEEQEEINKHNYRNPSEDKTKAEYAAEIDDLKNEIAKMIRSVEIREKLIVTCFAVGICAANADHQISDSEREEIELLVCGLGKLEVLSDASMKCVEAWYKKPPELCTVWSIIENNQFNSTKYIAIFDTIIQMVIMADDVMNDHEKEFIDAWNSLVA